MKKLTIIIPLDPKKKEIEALESINTKRADVLIERGLNPSENRNRGVERAKTEYVAFVNAHTILEEGWLDETEKFIKEHPETDIFGGPQLNHPGESTFSKASGIALGSFFGGGLMSGRYGSEKLDMNASELSLTSANMICKKEIFKKVRFDTKIYPGEDPKFINDAKNAGFRVAYSPKIIVYNKRRPGIGSFSKQIFRYGRMRTKIDSRGMKKIFFYLPSLFLIYLLLIPLGIMISRYYLDALLIYAAIALAFSAYLSIKNKNLLLVILLPLIFLVIHLSYGAGFIMGLIEK